MIKEPQDWQGRGPDEITFSRKVVLVCFGLLALGISILSLKNLLK